MIYGGELSDDQRRELEQQTGSTADSKTETISRAELMAGLQSAGVGVDGSERAISSMLVSCEGTGHGLRVRTQHITDIPAAAYASALIAAGISDAAVTVAAPSSNPVTGETALVGLLRAYPHCRGGQPLPPERLNLAYTELQLASGLAAANGAWDRAATAMLETTQSVVSAHGMGEADIGVVLDRVLAAEHLMAEPDWRAAATQYFARLAMVEHGPYGGGYQVEQLAVDDVVVRVAGP
jgi:uncharacterized protein YpuA (DUF1002 family)